MPTFPLYRAAVRLEDTLDEMDAMVFEPRWGFAPIPGEVVDGGGRFVRHVEGGGVPALWAKAEVGSRLVDGPGGVRLVTRVNPIGWDAASVAGLARRGERGLSRVAPPEPARRPAEDAVDVPIRAAAGPAGDDAAGGPGGDRPGPAGGAAAVAAGPVADPPRRRPLPYPEAVAFVLARDWPAEAPPTAAEVVATERPGRTAGEAAALIVAARCNIPEALAGDRAGAARRNRLRAEIARTSTSGKAPQTLLF